MKRYVKSVVMVIVCLSMISCTLGKVLEVSKTVEQKSYTITRSYNIFLDAALNILDDPNIPSDVKLNIIGVESVTTPIIDNLARSLNNYLLAKILFSREDLKEEEIKIILANLEYWLVRSEDAVVNLSKAVEGRSPQA